MNKKIIFLLSVLIIQIQCSIGKNKDSLELKSPILKNSERTFFKSEEEKKERTSKNVIKLNVTQLILTNPTIQYEHAFDKNLSGCVSFALLIPRNVPGIIFRPKSEVEGWQTPKFGGWAVTPEFRFYPGAKERNQAPHGFYFAPYFRYASYSLKADYYDLGIENGSQFDREYQMKANYSGGTAGLMMGSQWIIGKNFSFDFWIFGMGWGLSKFRIGVEAKDGNLNLTNTQQEELKNDIVGNLPQLGKFGAGSVEVETTPNSAKLTVKGIPMTSWRGFGFCFGYAF